MGAIYVAICVYRRNRLRSVHRSRSRLRMSGKPQLADVSSLPTHILTDIPFLRLHNYLHLQQVYNTNTMVDGPILVAPRPVRVAAFPPPSPVQWAPVASPISDSPLARLERMSLNENGSGSQTELNISMSPRELSPVR
jgi:hypothetical protein